MTCPDLQVGVGNEFKDIWALAPDPPSGNLGLKPKRERGNIRYPELKLRASHRLIHSNIPRQLYNPTSSPFFNFYIFTTLCIFNNTRNSEGNNEPRL